MFALTLGQQNRCMLDSTAGKIELCKTFAVTYYNGEGHDSDRHDCEYMEKVSLCRLTGPPGNLRVVRTRLPVACGRFDLAFLSVPMLGYEAGGQLTEAVRRSPS
jgi:hypothetical protein